MNVTKLLTGNEAVVHGALAAGCRCYFGYPITPQNAIPELMSQLLPKVGGQFVQAESEVASANMLLGAAATGTRALTSSSSPGISLKQEAIPPAEEGMATTAPWCSPRALARKPTT